MSTMTLISHRLFAAAAAHTARPRRRAARSAACDWPGPAPALALALELVNGGKPVISPERPPQPRPVLGQ